MRDAVATVVVLGAAAAGVVGVRRVVHRVQYLAPMPVGWPTVVTGYEQGARKLLVVRSIGRGFHADRGLYLAGTAARAFEAMVRAAEEDGIDLRKATLNAFRTQLHQERLYREYSGAARPGFSPHQRGVAVDINSQGTDSVASAWMHQNSERFGFVRTYASHTHFEYRP